MTPHRSLDRAHTGRHGRGRHARAADPRGLIIALSILAACGGGAGTPDDASTDGGDVDIGSGDAGTDAMNAPAYEPQPPVTIPPEPAPPDLSGYPVDGQGRPILGRNGSYHLVARQPDALTALSDCTAMIVRCVDPTIQGRSLDACAISPPRCATAQPWMEVPCCATTCVDRYQQLRIAGTPPITAFRQAFYGLPSCAPGVDGALGGTP